MFKKNIQKFYLLSLTLINIQNIQSFFCCKEVKTKSTGLKKENNSDFSLVALMRDNQKKKHERAQEELLIQENEEKYVTTCQNQVITSNDKDFSACKTVADNKNVANSFLNEENQHNSNNKNIFYFVDTANESEHKESLFSPQENYFNEKKDSNSREISNHINNSQGQLPSSAVQSTGKFPFYAEVRDSNSREILTTKNNDSTSQKILKKQDETRIAQIQLPFAQSTSKNPDYRNDLNDCSNNHEFTHDNSGSRHLPGAKTKSSDSPQSQTPTNLSPNEKAIKKVPNFKNQEGLSLLIVRQANQKLSGQIGFLKNSSSQASTQDLPHQIETENNNV